mmetsp:Transcript_3156/g.7530  ORF Transcript_3156/g.7530 Transcript_3156/m.7530 type:complete len:221 (-) Transcript_3156:167-829(-)
MLAESSLDCHALWSTTRLANCSRCNLADFVFTVCKAAPCTPLAMAFLKELAQCPLGGDRGRGHSSKEHWRRTLLQTQLGNRSSCAGNRLTKLVAAVGKAASNTTLTTTFLEELAQRPLQSCLAWSVGSCNALAEHQGMSPAHRPSSKPSCKRLVAFTSQSCSQQPRDERRARCIVRCCSLRCFAGRRWGPGRLLAQFVLPMRKGTPCTLLASSFLPKLAD